MLNFQQVPPITLATIMEKKIGTVRPILLKKSPPFPNAMLIWVMLPEATPGCPTLIDGGGVGKDMTNGELGGFFKTMHCPNVLSITSNGIVAISCIKCSNYFFHDCRYCLYVTLLRIYVYVDVGWLSTETACVNTCALNLTYCEALQAAHINVLVENGIIHECLCTKLMTMLGIVIYLHVEGSLYAQKRVPSWFLAVFNPKFDEC